MREKNRKDLLQKCKDQIDHLFSSQFYIDQLEKLIIENNSENKTSLQKPLHSDIPIQSDDFSENEYLEIYDDFCTMYAEAFCDTFGHLGYEISVTTSGVEISWEDNDEKEVYY